MSYIPPSVGDFKDYFNRDFPYGDDQTFVMDADIQKGLDLALFNFNESFYSSQGDYTTAFLYLAAHYMVMNLRASSQGIAGQYSWMSTAKAAGSVSQSLQIPQRILDNPELAMLSKTNYGAQYLFLILPQLTGQIFAVAGYTWPS